MPAASRRQKIEEMLRDEPEDTFLLYSLAMELCNEGQVAEALERLQHLCSLSPPYVPAFFRSAQILADEQRQEAARAFLRDGIDAARLQGDHHAAAEMGEMLADLGSAGE